MLARRLYSCLMRNVSTRLSPKFIKWRSLKRWNRRWADENRQAETNELFVPWLSIGSAELYFQNEFLSQNTNEH